MCVEYLEYFARDNQRDSIGRLAQRALSRGLKLRVDAWWMGAWSDSKDRSAPRSSLVHGLSSGALFTPLYISRVFIPEKYLKYLNRSKSKSVSIIIFGQNNESVSSDSTFARCSIRSSREPEEQSTA